jgi:hypothetical protein
MRNVLVFPNGQEEDFMYPKDRDVVKGTEFSITMLDESVHVLKVSKIVREEKRIVYNLSY